MIMKNNNNNNFLMLFFFYLYEKVVSGDDDLPQRDDIGERRRKHELRVLAGAGIKSDGDAGDENGTISDDGDVEMDDSGTGDSEDEFYEQVKEKRAAKLAAKAQIYSRCFLPCS